MASENLRKSAESAVSIAQFSLGTDKKHLLSDISLSVTPRTFA
jgi:hypothetical protein